jgi:hypothetical protein
MGLVEPIVSPSLLMTSKNDDHHSELSDKQIAALKKAIADLAESKRVAPDSATNEPIGTDLELLISLSDTDKSPPLSQHFLWRYKSPLVYGTIGIVIGFILSIL